MNDAVYSRISFTTEILIQPSLERWESAPLNLIDTIQRVRFHSSKCWYFIDFKSLKGILEQAQYSKHVDRILLSAPGHVISWDWRAHFNFLCLISSKKGQRWRFWVIAIFLTNIWLIFGRWQVAGGRYLYMLKELKSTNRSTIIRCPICDIYWEI